MNTPLNPELNKNSVIGFFFKVKNSKLDNKEKLQYQIELVVKRLMKTHGIKSERFELMFGTVDDDFVHDRFRLRILFNCASYVSVLYDVADFQQKAQYEAPKFELVKMFNRSTSAAILYSTC